MPRQTLSIVDNTSMFGVEVSGFYQTPNCMAIKAIQAKLTSADWCVWSYLQMIDPFGDRFIDIPNPQEIADILLLSEKSVRRSLHKLEELGFYATQIIAIKGKNLAGKTIKDNKLDKDKVVRERTKMSENGQRCPKTDKDVLEKTNLSPERQSCPNQPLEPAPSKASETPHTIHIYSDLNSNKERETPFTPICFNDEEDEEKESPEDALSADQQTTADRVRKKWEETGVLPSEPLEFEAWVQNDLGTEIIALYRKSRRIATTIRGDINPNFAKYVAAQCPGKDIDYGYAKIRKMERNPQEWEILASMVVKWQSSVRTGNQEINLVQEINKQEKQGPPIVNFGGRRI